MAQPLRALFIEDVEEDVYLLVHELRRGGYQVTPRRVDTAAQMKAALEQGEWDIIFSDFSVPGFGAVPALEQLKASGLDLPFIIMSGSIGEEIAFAAMKAGAHDFLIKNQLARLLPAVERELREAAVRRERRAAEQALRESERKYRWIVETTQEGIWMIDAEVRTTYGNRRVAEMLGLRPEELIGRSMFDFVDPAWAHSVSRSLERRRLGTAEKLECKFRRLDGSDFWAMVSSSAVIDAGGSYVGALMMVTDVSAERKLQEQLLVSDRMASVGLLAAGVAHEINNPLAAIVANLPVAMAEVDAVAPALDPTRLRELRETIGDALEAAKRIRNIVRDLKIFSSSQDDRRGPVDVVPVLESTIRMAWNQIRHRAKVVRDYQPVPPVAANEGRLGQVFLNLLVNAAEAVEDGRAEQNEIRIATRLDPQGRVVVEIQDTGRGMPPEALRQLFTPFFTTKPIGVGTGLGLAICHRIVSALGGEVSVDSVVGRGTVFRVLLPPSSESTSDLELRLGEVVTAPRRGQILAIDDETMVLSAIRRSLAGEHDVTCVASAREALGQLASGGRFDLIVCDLMMPDLTGMDFHDELMRILPEQAERIVFLTGGAFTGRARTFLGQIKNDCVEKPFDPNQLRTLINQRLRGGNSSRLGSIR